MDPTKQHMVTLIEQLYSALCIAQDAVDLADIVYEDEEDDATVETAFELYHAWKKTHQTQVVTYALEHTKELVDRGLDGTD